MQKKTSDLVVAANNGLLDRRYFLKSGVGAGLIATSANASEGKQRFPWMRVPGEGMGESGPSKYENHLKRNNVASQPGTTGSGASRTPIEHLDGVIQPSRLHLEMHQSGIPDINPYEPRLLIHRLVVRPLSLSMVC